MQNIEEETLKIIHQEFSNFLRDVGISSTYKSLDFKSSKVINKLFFEKNKNTIWFHNGKLYKVSLDSSFESNSNLKIYEVTPKLPIYEQSTVSIFSYKYSYWLLLIALAVTTYNTIYFSLVFISLVLFLLSDKISNFAYKIRFYFRK